MENWKWCGGRSADEIAAYVAYALRILHNIGLPCEGVTSPGGFGSDNPTNYSQAILHAVRDVYRAEIPHYFLHAFDDGPRSVAPRVENVSGLNTDDPRCIVSIVACTGDWTGSWDCVPAPEPDKYISADYQRGRVPEIIARNEPVCLLSHWTGFHYNGSELGFRAFQTVVRRINAAYGKRVRWMRLSEIARYAAARELTRIEVTGAGIRFTAPYACPDFTVRVKSAQAPAGLREVPSRDSLLKGTWTREGDSVVLCQDLPKGESAWQWAR
jgi:hypothetical protein